MTREELENLYKTLERYIATLEYEEYKNVEQAFKAVQTMLHKSINETYKNGTTTD